MFVTEHEFQLPKGYVDADGTLHTTGVMRLATAGDEILPMKDPRVQSLPAYLIVILLSRVVSKLGTLPAVHPGIIEGLFAEDLTLSRRSLQPHHQLSRHQGCSGCRVHWTHEELMNLDHLERRRWVEEVRRLEPAP